MMLTILPPDKKRKAVEAFPLYHCEAPALRDSEASPLRHCEAPSFLHSEAFLPFVIARHPVPKQSRSLKQITPKIMSHPHGLECGKRPALGQRVEVKRLLCY
jgi:hypothetical protein